MQLCPNFPFKKHVLTLQIPSAAVIKILKIIILGEWLGFFSPKGFTFCLPGHELKDVPYPANGPSQNMGQLETKPISWQMEIYFLIITDFF